MYSALSRQVDQVSSAAQGKLSGSVVNKVIQRTTPQDHAVDEVLDAECEQLLRKLHTKISTSSASTLPLQPPSSTSSLSIDIGSELKEKNVTAPVHEHEDKISPRYTSDAFESDEEEEEERESESKVHYGHNAGARTNQQGSNAPVYRMDAARILASLDDQDDENEEGDEDSQSLLEESYTFDYEDHDENDSATQDSEESELRHEVDRLRSSILGKTGKQSYS